MATNSTPEETTLWQRRLASQANNRAWRLSEATTRTPHEAEEMLQAAHAAMFFWNIVGNEGNRAHAALLLAHAYALLHSPVAASHYLSRCQSFFSESTAKDWEVAIAHAVAANVAAATGDAAAHAARYQEAVKSVAALPDPEDRAILEATLRAVPKPIIESRAGAA